MSRFERFCQLTGQHPLPASPVTVAAFIAEHGGLDAPTLFAEVAAIDQAHEALGYSPPGRSTIAIAAFNQVHPVEAPHGWREDERQFFACLPWGVQAVLARREAERDRGLQKMQRELAEQRKAVERELAEQKRITNRLQKDRDNGAIETEAA
jgi:hypothetical protein